MYWCFWVIPNQLTFMKNTYLVTLCLIKSAEVSFKLNQKFLWSIKSKFYILHLNKIWNFGQKKILRG